MTDLPRPPVDADAPARVRGRVARSVWMAAGFTSVGVGSIGVLIPGLPTTVFFIVAAWCFSRSSPRFERWVLELPKVGPMVRDHRAGVGIPRSVKRRAVAIMWCAIAISSLVVRDRPWVVVAIVALGLIGTWYLVRRVPTKR